jgi:hypothetical protein
MFFVYLLDVSTMNYFSILEILILNYSNPEEGSSNSLETVSRIIKRNALEDIDI